MRCDASEVAEIRVAIDYPPVVENPDRFTWDQIADPLEVGRGAPPLLFRRKQSRCARPHLRCITTDSPRRPRSRNGRMRILAAPGPGSDRFKALQSISFPIVFQDLWAGGWSAPTPVDLRHRDIKRPS